MKADADEIDGPMTTLATEDARQMCFSQGKSCVYASDDDRFIISETPTGVIDRHELATGQVTRVWLDGTEESFQESFPADSPKYREHPVWPRPATAACAEDQTRPLPETDDRHLARTEPGGRPGAAKRSGSWLS